MATSTQWQLSREAAARYEEILVAAILGPFAEALVEWAAPPAGVTVVDVGCGTGAATRAAAHFVGSAGRVVGIDVNAGMIAEATMLDAHKNLPIEWHEGSAYDLPLPDQSVDVVYSAQVLQFLADKAKAMQEKRRILKQGGLVALSAWCELEENPYFHAMVETITDHIGADVAVGLKAAFALPHAATLQSLLETCGFDEIEITQRQIDLPLPKLNEFVPRHIGATPMAAGYEAAPPTVQQAIVDEMNVRLAEFVTDEKPIVPFRSHMARARKR